MTFSKYFFSNPTLKHYSRTITLQKIFAKLNFSLALFKIKICLVGVLIAQYLFLEKLADLHQWRFRRFVQYLLTSIIYNMWTYQRKIIVSLNDSTVVLAGESQRYKLSNNNVCK